LRRAADCCKHCLAHFSQVISTPNVL
jgi:hypothetical protein